MNNMTTEQAEALAELIDKADRGSAMLKEVGPWLMMKEEDNANKLARDMDNAIAGVRKAFRSE